MKISRAFRFIDDNFVFLSLFILGFLLLLGLSSVSLNPTNTQSYIAGSLPTSTAVSHKHLKAIDDRRFKAVCKSTVRNMPTCAAEVVVNSDNVPISTAQPAFNEYGPVEFHTAYNLPCTPGGPVQSVCSTPSSFGPETIAIVDQGGYGGSDTLESNLDTFDSTYGLPACTTSNGCLSIVNQDDQASPLPPPDGSDPSGWALEMNLDLQTAHMICQTCAIVLYEASDVLTALNTAATDGSTVVSNSWLITGVNDSGDDSLVEHTGVAIVAASGDGGTNEAGGDYPSDNPDVVSASGTTLDLNTDNTYAGETVWADSGGGCATDSSDSAPSWQTSLPNWSTAGCGTDRAVGDMSADADPNTGLYTFLGPYWEQVGGTSLATPLIASTFALAGGVPSGVYAPSMLYQNFNSLNSHDITSGNDCSGTVTTNCTAAAGFDEPSGLGSMNGIDAFEAQPLTTPSSLTVTNFNQSSVDLSWSPSTSTFGVGGYDIYRNGSLVDTTTSTSYTDSGLATNTPYNYAVAAYDNSSDTSQSATTSATTYYPEDISEDGHINLLDLSILAERWGESEPQAGRADIKGYGQVNLLDLSLLAEYYGSE